MYFVFGLLFLQFLQNPWDQKRAVPQDQEYVDISSLHPLYHFPQHISQAIMNNYTNRLGWLYNQEFVIAPVTD